MSRIDSLKARRKKPDVQLGLPGIYPGFEGLKRPLNVLFVCELGGTSHQVADSFKEFLGEAGLSRKLDVNAIGFDFIEKEGIEKTRLMEADFVIPTRMKMMPQIKKKLERMGLEEKLLYAGEFSGFYSEVDVDKRRILLERLEEQSHKKQKLV